MLVDTGSEYTWLPEAVLHQIGVQPVKKDLHIQMANGQIITRSVGFEREERSSRWPLWPACANC